MSNFTVKSTQLRNSIGRGYATFEFTPEGYWSDVIQVTLNKGWGSDAEFTVDISNSSGGRNKTDNPVQVAENYVEAYQAAIGLAKRLEAKKAKYASYVAFKRRKDSERAEAERAAKQAKIDADPAIGEKMAKAIVARMKDTIKANIENDRFSSPVTTTFKKRGVEDTFTISLEQPGYTNTTRFYIKYNDKSWMEKSTLSRASVLEKIANSSIGSFITQ